MVVNTWNMQYCQLNHMLLFYIMTRIDINSKYVEFLNEAFATENAIVDRLTSRSEETPMSNLDSNKIVPLLKKNLDEELNMKKWCTDNMAVVIDNLLPKIISALSK